MEAADSLFILVGGLVILVAAIVFFGGFKLPRDFQEKANTRDEIRKKVLKMREERKKSVLPDETESEPQSETDQVS